MINYKIISSVHFFFPQTLSLVNPQNRSWVLFTNYIEKFTNSRFIISRFVCTIKIFFYSATVKINGKDYGKGDGSSKKEAKSEAARKTLEIFIPELKNKLPPRKGYVKKESLDLSVSCLSKNLLFFHIKDLTN